MPPQYAVAQVVGFIKGKAAIHMARSCTCSLRIITQPENPVK